MILIMVLLHLGHRVQKLLRYLLVLKPNILFAPVFTKGFVLSILRYVTAATASRTYYRLMNLRIRL